MSWQKTSSARSAAQALFTSTFANKPNGCWSAPGRVNLIGEHTDYNLGLVLPFAIADRAHVAATRTNKHQLRLVSDRSPKDVVVRNLDDLAPREGEGSWSDYLAGVWWLLAADHQELTHGGLDVALVSTVPAGAGLSSSAAIECAMAVAVADLFDLGLKRPDLARVAQRAENQFVGMPCGLMDQLTSMEGRSGHALAIDFASETVEPVGFDPAGQGLALLVIDTHVHHSLAQGEYAKRRVSCERAAAALGVEHLSVPELAGLSPSDLERRLAGLESVTRRRARHVITENKRVGSAIAHLRAGELSELGPLFNLSHASMAIDFEITCRETDAAQRAALEAGAVGARQTGGGFGGSVISLVDVDYLHQTKTAVSQVLQSMGAPTPLMRVMAPGPGAGRED